MSTPIGPFWAGDRPIASFRRNGRSGSHVPYPFTKGARRVALVCHHPQGNGGKPVEHGWRQRQFVGLSGSQRKTDGFSVSISNHADFRAIAAARAAKCFTMVSLFERGPFFLGSRRLVVRPDVRTILLVLNPFEQAFPYAEFRPADEKLGRPPPRTQFSGDAPPFRAILMAPENCCCRTPQIMRRRLAPWPNRLNQRGPDRPCLVRKGACSVSCFHPYNMGRNLRPNRP